MAESGSNARVSGIRPLDLQSPIKRCLLLLIQGGGSVKSLASFIRSVLDSDGWGPNALQSSGLQRPRHACE